MADIVSPYHPVNPSPDDIVGNDEIRGGTPNITTQNYNMLETLSRSVKDGDR